MMRECLTSNRIVPIRNESLSDAWARCANTLDLCGYRLTFQLPAEYGEASNINGAIPGGPVVIQGPSNVTAAGQLFRVNDGARFSLNDVTLKGGMGVVVASGMVMVNGVTFDALDIGVDVCGPDAIAGVGDVTFLARDFGAGLTAEDGGWINCGGHAKVEGARFSRCFAQADLGGMIDGTGFTYEGAAIGRRYQAYTTGIVFTGTGQARPDFFPGDQPGQANQAVEVALSRWFWQRPQSVAVPAFGAGTYL